MAAFLEAGVCLLAWKQRNGLGRYLTKKSWQQRWIVISGTVVKYFCVGEEDGDPRGNLDLLTDKVQINVTSKKSPDAPTQHQVDISAAPKEAEKRITWKFCFDTQEDLMQFLQVVHSILDKGGQIETKSFDRFEHDFQASDHIYRWEMIVCPPVIYPIQIHGIVLEAGRNCVVVADFGLTGYGRKEGDKFNYSDDHNSRAILSAWKKLRPNQDQRLNLLTLTDPMEIRKWTRANYEESFLKAHGGHKFERISKFFSSLKKHKRSSSDDGSQGGTSQLSDDGSVQQSQHSTAEGGDGPDCTGEKSDPETKGAASPPQPELPKSDPKEIVLARANFLLEFGEEKLPPYHVFYSNSECIAVWCKTGRWSTLQTAVFLGSTSVGAAKSATVTTIGVAAAHALLAPVVAVGGLIWVSAPMVILQKSRVQWEKNTFLMTDLFWTWAPPAVFVAAIENWSGLVEKDKTLSLPNEGDESTQGESIEIAR